MTPKDANGLTSMAYYVIKGTIESSEIIPALSAIALRCAKPSEECCDVHPDQKESDSLPFDPFSWAWNQVGRLAPPRSKDLPQGRVHHAQHGCACADLPRVAPVPDPPARPHPRISVCCIFVCPRRFSVRTVRGGIGFALFAPIPGYPTPCNHGAGGYGYLSGSPSRPLLAGAKLFLRSCHAY